MITKAYIHEYGNGQLEPEHNGVKVVLEAHGIKCELFTSKRLHRNQLQLDRSTLVVGDNPTIESVLKRIGYPYVGDCYPQVLRPYLHRPVWTSTVKQLRIDADGQSPDYIFIKPHSKTKAFTGFVVESAKDLYSIPANLELYCSSVVEWLSEYRVFINNEKIVGIKHYHGNHKTKLDEGVLENAIQDFEKSGTSTAAYALDFGVLESGETALIEWNDAFGLGGYGLRDEIYTDLILARWLEILATPDLKI